MNAADLLPTLTQAEKNLRNEWHWVMLRPETTIRLIEDTARLEDAKRDLEQIAALADRALMALADHHIDTAREILREIGEVAQAGS